MEINTNINPWAVGAVVLDQRPYLQFFQQQMAQRQAKSDAMDNYFRDLGKNVTPAGMRSQDVSGLTQKTNEWRQFYAQNKDAIMNPRLDNGKSYTEYMARLQDQLGYIEQSKNALKTTSELGKLKLDPNRSYMLDDPNLINQMQAHDKPLTDPERQELNLMQIATPPKPMGVKELESYSKYLTSNLNFSEVPGSIEKLPGFKTRTLITKQYGDDNLRVIGERAAAAYDADKQLQGYANRVMHEVQQDPERQGQLNATFKRLYGRDMQDMKDLLAAQSILNEDRKSIGYKDGEDSYGREIALMSMRQKNAKELIDYRKQVDPNDTEMNDLWVDQYLGKLKEEAKNRPSVDYKYSNGKTSKEYDIPMDPMLAKALSAGGVEPDAIRVDANGNFRRIFYRRYQEGETLPPGKSVGDVKGSGNQVSVDESLSRPVLSQTQVELALGKKSLTGKQLNKQMVSSVSKQPTKKYTINGQSYSHKQLNDMGYDDNEIAEAQKLGVIK